MKASEIIEEKLSRLKAEIEKHRRAQYRRGSLVFSLDSVLSVRVTQRVNRYIRSLPEFAAGEDGYTSELFGIPCEVTDEPGIFIELSIKF